MENNTELLKEYASLAGREDAKSEARKAEILSYIKTHANDAGFHWSKDGANKR